MQAVNIFRVQFLVQFTYWRACE